MRKIYEVNMDDKYYPKNFLKLKNPPQKIYIMGNRKLLNNESVVVVGSRDSTLYGEKNAKIISKELSQNGITIVSGLAKGIDSVAHKNAMCEKGKTIAVIGSGFNHIYPEENIGLVNEILRNGGTIVSEYSPDTEANLKKFPKRNILIAALGKCTIVVEAKARSGSGITARQTMLQEKPVFCLPGRIGDKTGKGTNNLIKNGANIFTDLNDIYDCLGKEKIEKKINKTNLMYIKKEYKKIYETIKNKAKPKNEIIRDININISELNAKLTLMEMEGLIEILPRRYS